MHVYILNMYAYIRIYIALCDGIFINAPYHYSYATQAFQAIIILSFRCQSHMGAPSKPGAEDAWTALNVGRVLSWKKLWLAECHAV